MNLKFLAVFSFLFCALTSYAAPCRVILVTDIDDTIKTSNSSDPGFAAIHGLFGAPAFAGMAALYNDMNPSGGLIALSGGPEFTRSLVDDFIHENGFAPERILLQPSLFDNTENFKVRQLDKLAQESDALFILVGDDTQHDPESFQRFQKAHPDRALAMYIHRVVGPQRVLPPQVIPYFTPLDLAQDEYLYGRLSASDFIDVGETLLESPENEFLPEYAACPQTFHSGRFLNNAAMRRVRDVVDARVRELCQKRYANPNWRRYYDR